MKLGKKIIFINSLIIVFLAAVIAVAATVAGTRVMRSNIRNTLVDTVSSRAAVIAAGKGIVPDDFDYNLNGVYLGVYLSDGSLKNGSFPGEVDLPIRKGIISTVRVGGAQYYVYDFAISLEGRNDIYLRGMAAASYDFWYAAMILVAVFAGVLAAVGVVLNIVSVKRAVKPIEKMRREVQEITDTKDITKRLSAVETDDELACLADDYNLMLDGLEGSLRNQERFTSDVAHELRTPLTVILSESEYALTDAKDVREKDESLEAILRQAGRLKAITESLLEFTRFKNRIKIGLAPVDISAVTEELLGDYVFPASISCQSEIEEGVTVLADVTLYERVLLNLVDNAVKYGKEGGHVIVTVKREGNGAALVVRDDGVGMSEEALEHAFDRFYREDPSRSGKPGLGLGLSLVREIVRLFGAKIGIASAAGEGTAVTVTFEALSPPQASNAAV